MRIAIVGGGILGSLTALKLAQSGCEVSLYDRGVIGGTQGASHGVRFIVVFYQNTVLRELMAAGMQGWRELEETFERPFLRTASLLEVFKDQAGANGLSEVLKQFSIVHSMKAPDGVVLPEDARPVLIPGRSLLVSMEPMMEELRRKLLAAKVELKEKIDVHQVRPVGAAVEISSGAGVTSFDRVVLATGHWAGQFCKEQQFPVPVIATAQPYFTVDGSGRFPSCHSSALPYVRDNRQGRRLIIPSIDGGDVRVVNAGVGAETVPGRPCLGEDQLETLSTYARSVVPALAHAGRLRGNSCWYTCAKDYNPIVGPSASCDAVHLLVPPAGGGVKMGPALANACVSQLLGTDSKVDLTAFLANRFAETT